MEHAPTLPVCPIGLGQALTAYWKRSRRLNQASCLNLMTNAVVAWNTVYMTAALDALTAEGYPIEGDDLAHLSPARYEHVNPYGKYRFEVEAEWSRKTLRPLRRP